MEQDIIKEIGIDKAQRLYIKPTNQKFIYIYREAMEVNWDNEEQILYGAKPREWSYLDWFNQIIKATRNQSCNLILNEKTIWINISDTLKDEILKNKSA